MAFTIACVLFVLSALHVWWGVEGVEATSPMIPQVDGKPAFVPESRDCYAVAAALALASILVVTHGGLLRSPFPEMWTWIGTVAVGAVLVLRAIGDFHTLGFFKRVRDTPFAEWDTHLFSPLSLVLGVATLYLAFIERMY